MRPWQEALPLAAALSVMGLLAACSLLPPPTFDAAFLENGNPHPIPVRLVDRTGLVSGLEIPGIPVPRVDGDGVEPIDGRPTAVALDWVGGGCAAEIEFARSTEGQPFFTIRPSVDENCQSGGMFRQVIVQFTIAVDQAKILLIVKE